MRKIYTSRFFSDDVDDWDHWDDFLAYRNMLNTGDQVVFPTSIKIWTGQFLDKMQVSYGNTSLEPHGVNEPGRMQEFKFSTGEYITFLSVNVMPWDYQLGIRDMILKTNKGKRHEFHSWSAKKEGMRTIEYTIPPNAGLVAFAGQGGKPGKPPNWLQGLSVHYAYPDAGKEPKNHGFTSRLATTRFFWQTFENRNPDASLMPVSNVWVNETMEVDVARGRELLCVSVSAECDGVAMPNGVQATMYDPSGKALAESQSGAGQTKWYGGCFYQMYCVHPEQKKYTLHLRYRYDAKVFAESQIIQDNSINAELSDDLQSNEEKTALPAYTRPLQRLLIANAEPELADPPKGGRQPASIGGMGLGYWLVGFAVTNPWAAGAIVLGVATAAAATAIFIALRKSPADKISEKAAWSTPDTGDRATYHAPPADLNYRMHAENIDARLYDVDPSALAVYKRLLTVNKNNMKAGSMSAISADDFGEEYKKNLKGKKIRVDIGGEGRYGCHGIESGAADAFNFNGRLSGMQQPYSSLPIPMLIHFTDWTKERFPFADGTVDAFLMQSTGNPTQKQADEMTRCLNRKRGRIDFEVIGTLTQNQLLCFDYIQAKLGEKFMIFHGAKLAEKEYPHLAKMHHDFSFITIYTTETEL